MIYSHHQNQETNNAPLWAKQDSGIVIPSGEGTPYMKLDIENGLLFIIGDSSSPLAPKLYLRAFRRAMSALGRMRRFTISIGLGQANLQSRKLIETFISSARREFPELELQVHWCLSRFDGVGDFGLRLMEQFGAEPILIEAQLAKALVERNGGVKFGSIGCIEKGAGTPRV